MSLIKRAGAMACALVLSACATSTRDGPPPGPPPDVTRIPDAQPQVEPIRAGGPNKPYEVEGQSYTPLNRDEPFVERGLASWYGRAFHGKKTALGEPYDMNAMTAAHRTMPLPSYAKVRNPKNGREIVVRVNDRGPFVKGRVIDLSYVAALKLGVQNGVAPVEVTRITFDDIRTGAWKRGAEPGTSVTSVARAAEPVAPVAPMVAAPIEPPRGSSDSAVAVVTPVRPQATEPAAVAASDAVVLAAFKHEKPLPAAPVAVAASAAASAVTAPVASSAVAVPGFWVQLGAFKQRSGADAFHQRVIADLEWLAPRMDVQNDGEWFRLQAGPYASRDEAQQVAQRVRQNLKLVPMVVEKR